MSPACYADRVIALLRERLTVALILLLPLHAALVTILTRVVAGTGHAPLPGIALWKDVLLLLIVVSAAVEWGRRRGWRTVRLDAVDLLILALTALLGVVSFWQQREIAAMVLGFKYDLWPMIAFLVLRRVTWSAWFWQTVRWWLVVEAGALVLWGLFMLWAPLSWLSALGYAELHSLYMPDAPLAPFQQVGGTVLRRMQSTMSGPNQFGLWLLLPWAFTLQHYWQTQGRARWMWACVACCTVAGIALTFSRAAWIGALVVAAVIAWSLGLRISRRLAAGALLAIILVTALLVFIAPSVVLRAASTQGHWRSVSDAVTLLRRHPAGLGLGTAGPASNRLSQTCVLLPQDADPIWAQAHPSLCVFVGDVQVQPVDQSCNCPLLTENWYLQIGLEGGVVAMLLFVVLLLQLARILSAQRSDRAAPVLAFLVGISVAALVLHAWEDTAVSYSFWILAAVLSAGRFVRHEEPA